MVSNRKTRARELLNTVVDNGSLGVKKVEKHCLKGWKFCHHLLNPQVISNFYECMRFTHV